MDNLIDIALYLGYFLVIVAVLITLGAGIVHMVRHFQKDQDTLYGIIALVVVLGVSYLLSDNQVLESYRQYHITPGQSHWIGTGLIMTYILAGIAIIGMIAAEIISMFR